MYTRLAFSVAAHLEPEILLVDEVLAVGDAAFQKKCLGRMGELARGGRTVVFVSHNMGMIRQLCSNCLLLDGGRLVAQGPTGKVVEQYLKDLYDDSEAHGIEAQLKKVVPDVAFELQGLRIVQEGVETLTLRNGKETKIEVEYSLKQDVDGFHVVVQLARRDGTVLFESLHDGQLEQSVVQPAGTYISCARVPPNTLRDGGHVITLIAGIHNVRHCLVPPLTVPVDVIRDGTVNRTYPAYDSPGLLLLDLSWETRDLTNRRLWPATNREEE
jgi:lipopolysaccharide transport system ATP-binding protein